MLALMRAVGESIIIDERIRVVVVKIQGDKVRLAISAPAEVPIYREEIYNAILSERQSARNQPPPDDAAHFADRP